MLIASYLAYFIGPFIFQLCLRVRNGLPFLEGFIIAAITGLSLSHLTHFIGEHNFFLILAILAIGLYLPNLFEGVFSNAKTDIHSFVHLLVVVAFLIHVFLEASVLGHSDQHGFNALSSGILIHRVADGMLIWWLLPPRYGKKIAGVGISLLVISNLIGFFFADQFNLNANFWDYLEILMAGMLLHVLLFSFHLNPSAHSHGKSCCKKEHVHHSVAPSRPRGFGYLTGLIFLALFFFFLSHDHHGHSASNQQQFFHNLLELFYLSAPALLIAFILSGIIQVGITVKTLNWFNKGGRFYQAFKGMILGLPLPICSCGILPFYQTLTKKGLAPSAGLAFLISTPELGLDALLISLPLLGFDLTIARLLAAIFLALGISLILSPFLKGNTSALKVSEIEKDSNEPKLKQVWNYSTKKIVDDIAPLVVLGLVIAALFKLVLGDYNLAQFQGYDIFLAALIGIFLYVCASGATPVVAVFLAAGVSPGAAISFLLTGPATNISTFAMLSKLHGKTFSILFACLALLLATVAGLVTNLVLGDTVIASVISEGHNHQDYKWWEHLSVALVCLLFFGTFCRKVGVLKK